MRIEFIADTDVSNSTLDVALDREGIEKLIDSLRWLQMQEAEHVHFFSASWGEGTLTQSSENPNAFNKVSIYKLADPRT